MNSQLVFNHEFVVEEQIRIVIYSGMNLHSFYTDHPELLDEIRDHVKEQIKSHTLRKAEEHNR